MKLRWLIWVDMVRLVKGCQIFLYLILQGAPRVPGGVMVKIAQNARLGHFSLMRGFQCFPYFSIILSLSCHMILLSAIART